MGLERESTDKIYNKFIEVMGRCIMEGRKVVVTINKISELTIQNGLLRCEMMPEFVSHLNNNNGNGNRGELKPARLLASELQQQKQRAQERFVTHIHLL